MKRCNNCGWFNFDAVSQCEKCGEESFEPIVESNEAASEAAVVEAAPQVEVKEEPKVESKIEPEQAAAVSNSFMATVAYGAEKAKPSKVSEPKPKKDLRATVVFGSDKDLPEVEEPKPKSNFKSTVAIGSDMPMPVAEESKPKSNFKATVAIGSDMPMPAVEESKPKNNFKATVAIGSNEPVQPAITVKEAVDMQQQMAASVKCPKCCYPITGYVEYCPNCGATIKNAPKPVAAEVAVNGGSRKVDRNLAKTVRDFSSCLKDTVAERVDDGPASETYRLVNIDAKNVPAIEVRLGEVFVVNGVRYKLEK